MHTRVRIYEDKTAIQALDNSEQFFVCLFKSSSTSKKYIPKEGEWELGLGYQKVSKFKFHVVVYDYEYKFTPGNPPEPVCVVYKELHTGQITK